MYRFNKDKMMDFLKQKPNKILLFHFLSVLQSFISDNSDNYQDDMANEQILEMKQYFHTGRMTKLQKKQMEKETIISQN